MDRHAWIDERLQSVPLFQSLNKKQLGRLSALATQLEVPAGKVLAREDTQGYEFVIVLDGEVEVLHGDRVVATCGPGDYFGEIALIEKRPRTATVIAKTPATIEVIARNEFLALLDDVPELAEKIRPEIDRRLAELGIEDRS
jgi:CRP-like cAMP-binding protein